jgi:hypothetical protein
VQAAVDSITDAGPGKPYVVRIMPGTYLEAVTLKDSISLVGSGPEATAIESTTTAPTVTATAADVTLADLKLVDRTGNVALSESGWVTGKSITLRNVVVESYARSSWAAIYVQRSTLRLVDSTIVSSGGGMIVRSQAGVDAAVVLERSVIRSTSGTDGDWALGIMGPNVSLRESRVVIDNPFGAYAVMVERGVGTIVNSEILVTTATDDQGAYGLTSYDYPVTVRGSRIDVATASSVPYSSAIDGANLTIDGSVVRGPACGICPTRGAAAVTVRSSTVAGETSVYRSQGGTFRIAGSTLAGPHDLAPGVDKVVNCQDGDFNPLPNL